MSTLTEGLGFEIMPSTHNISIAFLSISPLSSIAPRDRARALQTSQSSLLIISDTGRTALALTTSLGATTVAGLC
jgi:hypothetical protein